MLTNTPKRKKQKNIMITKSDTSNTSFEDEKQNPKTITQLKTTKENQ